MAKQLNVNLAVTADTKQAQANLKTLNQSLLEISNIRPVAGLPLKKEIQEAVNSAKSLQTHLSNAFNVKTGNLDLKMLNKSLASSGESLQSLTSGLLNCGIQGEKAFMDVQRSIATAGVQINKTQSLLGQFLTTLKNTARWQLSSSLLHGVIGQFNQAIGYAKDLDKSLNNIRIVTGYSAEEMSKFAKEANAAAKALRTTTTEYTDAALIYYQQGLGEKEVKERTDITIKMANIARESAETVSDQLTAVWNNFAENGTQSLEHYADAMTKLGAETASSTDEIAGGLEKFASIADMIGLSFDNAAAALATITATTRQSEDVVGTALKTIFARIQGLQLGETLDDGTTLNKYSEALAKIGVSIYDAGGGLKDMDKILEEMGAKWESISDTQQVALAQTVAGVRQYNQLVALMNNYDFYQQNLSTAKNADGELNKQQAIYEESWEAARDRVKASMQDLYEDLIPTDTIVDMTNGFAKALDVVDYLVEGIGGLEGILLMISSIAINKLGPSLAQGINVGIDNTKHLIGQFSDLSLKANTTRDSIIQTNNALNNITGGGLKTATEQTKYFSDNLKTGSSEMLKMQQASIAEAATQAHMTDQFKIYLSDVSKVNNLQATIEQNSRNLTAAQKERLAAQQQELLNLADAKALEQEKLETIKAQKYAILDLGDNALYDSPHYNEYYNQGQRDAQGITDSTVASSFDSVAIRSEEIAQSWVKVLNETQAVEVSVTSVGQGVRYTSKEVNGISNASKGALNVFNNIATMNSKINGIIEDGNVPLKEKRRAIHEIVKAERQVGNISKETAQAYHAGANALKEGSNGAATLERTMSTTQTSAARFAQSLGNTEGTIRQVATHVAEMANSESRLASLNNQFNNSLAKTAQLLQTSLQAALSVGGTISKMAGGFSTIAMGINAVSNAIDQLEEGELNLVTASMALVMGFQSFMAVAKGVQTLSVTLTTKKELETIATQKNSAALLKEMFVKKFGVETDKAAAMAEDFLTVAKEKGTAAAIKQTMANLGLQASLGLILVVIAAVASAAFLLYKAFQWSKEQSPEYKLQQAEERAKALEESLDEAKTAAEELKSAFDNYDSVKKTLDECVKGTEEWTEALKANNDAVLDLMSDYPELSSMVNDKGESAITRDGGVLEVADWAREELEDKADRRVNVAQAAAISGRQAVREAQLNVDKSDFYNDFYQKNTALAAQQNEYDENGNVINSTDGSYIARSLIMENAAELSRMNKEELVEALTKLFNDNQLSGDINSWVDAIIDMGPEFRTLADSIDANTRAIENENDVIAQSALANNQAIQSSKYKDQVLTASGDLYEQLYEQEMQKLTNEGYGTDRLNKAHGTGGRAKEYWNEYLEAAGLDAADYKLVDTTGTDAKRKFVYKQDGEEKEIDLETMKTAIASAKAMEALGQSAEELMKKFMELGATTGDVAKDAANRGMISFLSSQNLEGATKGEFNALKGSVDINGDGVTQEESNQYLIDNFGVDGILDNEMAKKYGFDTAQQMKDAFYESMQINWESIELPDDLINIDSISMASAKAFEGIYEDLEEGGQEALTGILNGFDLSALDPAEQTAVWDKLAAIDWSNWDAVEQAANIVTEAGGYLDNTNTSWAEYIALLRDATNAVPDLRAMKEELNAIDEISKDISLGDIITKEDYETLMKYNQGLAQYFAVLSDGSAKFIGDQIDFQQQVKDTKISALKDAGIMYQDRSGELMNQYNSQLDLMGGDLGNFEDFAQSNWYTDQQGKNWYKGADTRDQLEFLKLQGYDPDQIAKWEEDMADGTSYKSTIDNISEAVIAQGGAFQATKAEAEAYMASYQATMNEIALLAEDSAERLQMLQEGSINQQAYDAAVNAAINTEAWEDLDVAEVQEYADYLEDAMDIGEEGAEEVARAVAKMNKGVETLSDNWEEWGSILKTGNKEGKEASKLSQEYAKAMQGTRKALSDVLDVSEDFISTDFVSSAENLELIEKAAKGDAKAIDELGRKLSEDIATSAFKAREAFQDLGTDAAAEELEGFKTKLQEVSDLMQSQLGEGALNLGDTLSGTDELFAKLQEVVTASGMTAEQANAYYRSMGFTPNFKMVEVTQAESVPITTTHHTRTVNKWENGQPIEWVDKEWSTTEQVSGGEMVSQFPSLAMGTADGQMPQVPSTEIESVTYTGGGSLNNKSSTNSGGNKGSGGKKNSTKKKEDEIERYHTVNKEMDAINRKMDRAAGAKDAAFGRDKLPYIQKEIDAINDLIEKHQEYKAEIAKNLVVDKDKLAGFGFIDANADGILDNWEQVMEEQLRIYNEAAKAYDSGALGEKAFQEASDKYEEFKKFVAQYEETQELWEEAIAREEELERERISKELEKITTEIEFEIEIDQRDLDKLDYIVDKLGRNINNMIEIIDTLGTQVSSYQSQSDWYADGINRIKANAAEEGRALTDEEQRKIWEYEDALLGINNSLMDMVETVENSVMEEFERLSEEIDENIDRFDTYNSMLDHYNNIIKLSGRQTKDSMLLMKLSAQQTDTAMEKLNATNDKYLAQQEAQKDAAEKLATARRSGNKADIEYWEKQYEEITKAVEESHDAMLGSWEDVLQAASDQFDLAIELTIQKLKDAISEYGLDGLADRYEKAKTENEQYLSQLDKEYELNKLIRQMERSVDETDNIKAKQALNDLLDQANEKMAENVQLSQYDLEYMQKQYDLELARIALEEAQNAKSTVRLSRDNEGNFGYVYTADQDKIDDATQNYEDKLAETRQLSEEYIQEMSDLIIQNEQDLMDALASIDKTRFETKEEYEAEVERITKYYLDRDIYLRTELDKAVQNSGKVYSDTILGQLEDASTWEEAHNNLKNNTNEATDEMIKKWDEWKTNTEGAMAEVGSSSESFTEDIEEDMEDIGDATEDLADEIDTQTSNMITYIGNLVDAVEDWRKKYIDAIDSIIKKNEELALSEGQGAKGGVPAGTPPPAETKPDEEIPPSTDNDGSSAIGSKKFISEPAHYDASGSTDNKYPPQPTNGNMYLVDINEGSRYPYGVAWKKNGARYGWVSSFDTGGYTGDWGPQGKLAMLHEKELVLNKDDTSNLLQTVDFIHKIISMIDSQAHTSSLFNMSAAAGITTGEEMLEQTVTIHAEFPNATNHNEIEEAFNNLINTASQYANRK